MASRFASNRRRAATRSSADSRCVARSDEGSQSRPKSKNPIARDVRDARPPFMAQPREGFRTPTSGESFGQAGPPGPAHEFDEGAIPFLLAAQLAPLPDDPVEGLPPAGPHGNHHPPSFA